MRKSDSQRTLEEQEDSSQMQAKHDTACARGVNRWTCSREPNTAPKPVAIPVEAGGTRKEGVHTARIAVLLRLMPVVGTGRGILVLFEVNQGKFRHSPGLCYF